MLQSSGNRFYCFFSRLRDRSFLAFDAAMGCRKLILFAAVNFKSSFELQMDKKTPSIPRGRYRWPNTLRGKRLTHLLAVEQVLVRQVDNRVVPRIGYFFSINVSAFR